MANKISNFIEMDSSEKIARLSVESGVSSVAILNLCVRLTIDKLTGPRLRKWAENTSGPISTERPQDDLPALEGRLLTLVMDLTAEGLKNRSGVVFSYRELARRCAYSPGQQPYGSLARLKKKGFLECAESDMMSAKGFPATSVWWLPNSTIDALPMKRAVNVLPTLERWIVDQKWKVSARVVSEVTFAYTNNFAFSPSALGRLCGYEPPSQEPRFQKFLIGDQIQTPKLKAIAEDIFEPREPWWTTYSVEQKAVA